MIHNLKKHNSLILLLFIVIIGAFLRFYKLDWGQGLFTHPDEYHIVTSVNQLSFPDQMHPHFFSYGTVTIYLIFFTQEIIKFLSQIHNSEFIIQNSFLVGRFYSALFSTLTILAIYKICRIFIGTKLSLLAAFLVALTPGLIQQAHFATPESAQTLFLFTSLFFMLKFIKLRKILYSILASVFLGLALGVKISSIVFFLPLAIVTISSSFKNPLRLTEVIFTSVVAAFTTFALVAPYVFLDFQAFRSNLEYEGSLAFGKTPIFYTRQFIDTIPIFFQIEKILPYALGLILLVFGILGFFSVMLNLFQHLVSSGFRSRNKFGMTKKQVRNDTKEKILLIVAFLALFLPNAFLFAKWTRFIAPTFPFFAIFTVIFLEYLTKKTKKLSLVIGIILVSTSFLWSLAFFSIYLRNDIRIDASNWLEANTFPGSTFLVEGGNMVDLPLRGNYTKTSLNFYDLEENPIVRQQIADALYTSDYFLVQSRRVFMNHQKLPYIYPKTANFYNALFDGRLGFEQIKEFRSFPKLKVNNLELEINDESAEETWSVFDHPVIRVFKKNASLSREEYARFFEN